MPNGTVTTKNRKLEQFFFAHGIDYLDCRKDPEDGMTVWTYPKTEETEHIVAEFKVAIQRRIMKGA